MNIDHCGVKKIRLFVLRLNDARFVQAPGAVLLKREKQLPSLGAETEITLLARSVGYPFGVAMLDRSDIHVTAHYERYLFPVGAQGHFRRAFIHRRGPLDGSAIGNRDPDRHFLRISGIGSEQIDLSLASQ